MTQKAFIYSPELEAYPYPPSCPFNTSRAGKARAILTSMGLLIGDDKIEVAPPPATREVLETFHTPEYLDALERLNRGEYDSEMLYFGLGTGDCPAFKGVWDYSVLACGASVLGAEWIVQGKASVAFNPSGGLHHAFPDRAAGFCYLNDVVLGCETLAKGNKRVVFLDIDVHHTDGVQAAFYDRNDVMTISLHQDGRTLFPGTGFVEEIGEGEGKGYAINIPLPMGTYDEAYLRAVRQVVLPLIHAFGPDVLALEIGADTLSGDPLANLSLTNNVIADVIGLLRAFGKPILATGGGGYHVDNTARAWALAWTALCGEDAGADAAAGLGGVMLETADWHGGLRDRVLAPSEAQKCSVDQILNITLDSVKKLVFPHHGL
ncbi:MAG: acetoin utilization protein AcuC [Sedimentisphaerales bacterium]|nr:acetoin utilization protein AcuC [Sedimentisphaerales bacterium]